MSKTTVFSGFKVNGPGQGGRTAFHPYEILRLYKENTHGPSQWPSMHTNDAYLLLLYKLKILFAALPKSLLPSTSEFTSDKSFISPSSFKFVWHIFFGRTPLSIFWRKKESMPSLSLPSRSSGQDSKHRISRVVHHQKIAPIVFVYR